MGWVDMRPKAPFHRGSLNPLDGKSQQNDGIGENKRAKLRKLLKWIWFTQLKSHKLYQNIFHV